MYVKFNAAYQFGLGSNPASAGSGNISPNGFNIKNERVDINHGKDVVCTVALGYKFTGNIGAVLVLSYLNGKKIETESRYYYPNYYITETRRYKTYSKMTLIQPALILTTGNGKLKPSVKLGMELALGKIYESQHNALYSESREMTAEYSGGQEFGVMSAAGLTLEANEKLDFFLEFTMHHLTYSPARRIITDAKENGVSTRYKYDELTYSDEYYQYYNEKGEPLQVNQTHNIHYPMSSVGVGLGIKIRI